VRSTVARSLRTYGVRRLEGSPRARVMQMAARLIPDVILVIADQHLKEPATLITELRTSSTTRDTPIVVRLASGGRATSDALMMAGADRVLAEGPDTAALPGALFRLAETTSPRRAIREVRRALAAVANPTLVQLASALQQSKTMMVAADSSGRCAAINDGFVTATAYARDDVIGQPVWDFLQPGNGRDIRANWRTFLVVGIFQGACLLRRKYAQPAPVQVFLASDVLPGYHVAAVSLNIG
jgi:PAS domain-containing protein